MATITGTNLDDILATTASVDVLTALNGNDVVLVALAAHHGTTESLNGGAGFDRLWFTSTSGGDTLVLLAATTGFESFQMVDAVGNAFGTTALNLNAAALTVGAVLAGNDGANLITGSAKNDTLVGGGGADTLNGGLGDDRIVIDAAATDTANAGLQAEGNTLVLVGAATGVAILDMAAADQLVSFGVAADATVQSGFSNVDASGMGAFGVQITGSAVKNMLIGGAGNDVFVYANQTDYGADTVSGGHGDDALRFSSTTASSLLTLNATLFGVERIEIANATGDASGVTALNLNAAAVKYGVTLVGNDGNNSITGSAFNDKLFGNGGSDTLAGGAGNDIYIYDNASDGGAGLAGDHIKDTVGTADYISFADTLAGATLVLGADITGIEGVYAMGADSLGVFDEHETTDRNIDGSALLAATGLKFIGNAGANILTGGAGKDTLIGNGGADTIFGGAGSDLIVMDVGSFDVIDAGDATATEINTLRLVGDLSNGPTVIDLGVAANADQLLQVNGSTGDGTQSDFTNVDASALTGLLGVTITGSSRANNLVGTSQADVFGVLLASDFTTADSIQGGLGIDTIRFTSVTAGTTLAVGANIVSVEEVEISDITGDNSGLTALNLNAAAVKYGLKLTGNDGANTLTGSAFNDTLTGGGGNDLMVGGLGDDEYLINKQADFAAGERISDSAGLLDRVRFASLTDGEILTLTAQVTGIERIDLGAADTITASNIGVDASTLAKAVSVYGNDGNNTIVGTKFNDYIEGGKGADSIVGGLGSDTISISLDAGDADDANAGLYAENNLLKLTGVDPGIVNIDLSVAQGVDQTDLAGVQSGFTRVDASGLQLASVQIIGSARADLMIGGKGDDYFVPGGGADTIEGGEGNDSIAIHSLADLTGDKYTDSGASRGDYILFDSTVPGATLTFLASNSFNGWDAAATSTSTADTTNLNINASALLGPFGLSGNAGNNLLISTNSGESIFDFGGRDTMKGGGGDDDYVIVVDWVDGGVGVGDQIIDSSGTRDDMYNATGGQVILVNPATVSGIERFVVSSPNLSNGGPYVRDTEVYNNGGFDLHLWKVGTLIAGSFGANQLIGTAFADTIIGSKGEDTIVGGAGLDVITMEVGTGDVDAINAGLSSEKNQLILTGIASGAIVMDLGVADGQDQLLTIGGSSDFLLVQSGFRDVNAGDVTAYGVEIHGSAATNIIIGTGQDDVLEGRAGADTLVGGGGNDVFLINSPTDYVAAERVDGGTGTNDIVRFTSTTAGQTLTVLAGTMVGMEGIDIADATGDASGVVALNVNATAYFGALKLHGNEGNNLINGTAFQDTLAGGGGADTLRGNGFNDVYTALTPGEVVGDVIIDTEGGFDAFRFISQNNGDLVVLNNHMTGLEIAETSDVDGDLTGVFNTGVDASAVVNKLTILGNAGANTLVGTAFGDVIDGGLGADSIVAGGGADTITMALEAADMDDIDGGAIAEGNMLVLTGDPGVDLVWDLSAVGNQMLTGNGGHTITNITSVDASGVTTANPYPIGVTFTGSAQANILIGGIGNDVFIEKAATDFAAGERIAGGTGDDVLRFTSSGTDTLVLSKLVTGIELVQVSDAAGVLTGTAAVGVNAAAVGNALRIEGNDGANALTGTAFLDTIVGGAGHDTIVGGAGADVIIMQISAADIDAINAGAVLEGNRLVLVGAAAGTVTVDLTSVVSTTSLGDQLTVAGDTLVQSGFLHLDASGVTGFGVSVTGSAGNNIIYGTALADTINGGLGADTISFDVGGASDLINAGALGEGNSLVLTGAAAGTVVVDLSSALDQVTSIGGADATVQSGFVNVDASGMTGAGVNVTGSIDANVIVGSAQADIIASGAGADRIVWDASTASDSIDAGSSGEGDTFVITGTAAGTVVVNLAVAPGSDQLLSINAVADVAVQSDFQNVDARDLSGGGLNARGDGLNNIFHGTDQADTLIGGAGADSFWLGSGDSADSAVDKVVYERPEDGIGSAGAGFSFDSIHGFKSGQDVFVFTGAFNGGPNDLDDITADDAFQFATNTKANFASVDEGLMITASGLTNAAVLNATGFASVVAAINKVGVVAETGDDGLIVVTAGASAGIYYYQELDGIVNKVAASELTLLGVVDNHPATSDLIFA